MSYISIRFSARNIKQRVFVVLFQKVHNILLVVFAVKWQEDFYGSLYISAN
jgi:hypothetical protein